MDLPATIGYAAGTLTTLSFVPQVARSWRRRSVSDLSLAMILTYIAGVGLWTAYGVVMGATPIIVTNGLTLVLAFALLAMKLKFS